MQSRIDALTSLRFFAAISVVLFHFGRQKFEELPWWLENLLMKNGPKAVTFFFLLSGFVLTYSYFDEKNGTLLKNTRRQFWGARLARIYPAYILALLISFVPFVSSTFVFGYTSPPVFWGGIVCCPLFLQAWIPPLNLVWNFPAWSLSVEAFFYLAFPFIIQFLKWRSSGVMILIAFMFVMASDGWQTFLLQNGSNHDFCNYFPLWHLPTFFFGMTLGHFFLMQKENAVRFFGNHTLIGSVLIISLIEMMQTKIPSLFLSASVFILFYGILVLSAANCRNKLEALLAFSYLTLLGEASYGIYILHAPVGWWMKWLWGKSVYLSALPYAAFLASYLIFLILLCVAVFIFFEKPMRRVMLNRLDGTRHGHRTASLKAFVEVKQ